MKSNANSHSTTQDMKELKEQKGGALVRWYINPVSNILTLPVTSQAGHSCRSSWKSRCLTWDLQYVLVAKLSAQEEDRSKRVSSKPEESLEDSMC